MSRTTSWAGGGSASRLTAEVREKRGLTYDISTELADMRRAAVVEGLVATRADAMGQTLQAVRDTMAKFAAEGPHGAGAHRCQDLSHRLLSAGILLQCRNRVAARRLPARRPDVGYIARRNDLINAVTIDDVRRVARRLFDPSRLTVVVAGTMKNKK